MKILMVGKYFYPVIGGVEIHMQNLAKALIKRGHTVEVFTSNTDMSTKKLPETGEIEGITITRFPHVLSLMRALLKSDCNVIHYHIIRKAFVDFGIIAGKLKGKPLVFTPHCVYPPQSFLYGIAKKVYDSSLGFLSLRAVDRIISLTENDKIDVIAMGADPEKIVIVPNCIAFKKFEELKSPDLFREKYPVEKFLLFVGRIDWNKGLEYAVEAVPLLQDMGLSLVIIGEDVGYKKLLDERIRKLGIEDHVIFTGKVSDEVLLSAYAACTLFVLPAFYEGLPTVVLEAMAYKKPVIATKTGGTKYVITHGYNGFLIEYGDPQDIYEKVKEALASDVKKIGEHAREEVKAKYTWEVSAAQVEKVYEDLLKRDR
jgi:glycosyltransferase involved in cell wall biosynthesis